MFQGPRSTVDISFWEALHRIKLEKLRLDSPFLDVTANISAAGGRRGLGGSLRVDGKSFEGNSVSNLGCCTQGAFLNVNTIEEFQRLDKKALVECAGSYIWRSILDGSAICDPNRLFSFLLVAFADLKKHVFTYWFAFPAIVSAAPFSLLDSPVHLCDSHPTLNPLVAAAYSYIATSNSPVFVLTRHRIKSDVSVSIPITSTSEDDVWSPFSLHEYFARKADILAPQDIVYVVLDAAASPDIAVLGWGVRNVLACLSMHAPAEAYNVLTLRSTQLQDCLKFPDTPDHDNSILFRVGCVSGARSAFPMLEPTVAVHEPVYEGQVGSLEELYRSRRSCVAPPLHDPALFAAPSIVGWEPNDRGKPGPRVADLGAVMNSEKLMEQAVDLNVKLMRWRQWPTLDTEGLSRLKCLLIGAGTLGCATARALMGWGIRHITLIDNGRVSFSNPARQSLFEFEDAENKAFKAVAAAQRLKKIFPGMTTAGHVLTIAMPGHPIDPLEETAAKCSFEQLRDLIDSHDVVYALTDSREARWLPSLLCAAMDKLLINSALGFSTYLVMRHGGAPAADGNPTGAPRPGCYFCNDVVAPVDSMKDRSLDQQCTVTRPGLALIAGGLASELTVALMNSPHKGHHPLPVYRQSGNDDSTSIDDIPHQIRGSLNSFTQTCPVTPCFTNCTACSAPVVAAFKAGCYEFIRDVCADSSILEHISGISALKEGISDELLASMEMDSEDEMIMDQDNGDDA